ncbi:MAG TPA: CBS domain-containing protein [Chloroflexota bacterium]|nr:CBS domain-containing protein [Chloroflexota bacterium]
MGFFFLSQVLRRPVRTGRGERVARLKDLVARLEALNAGGEVALETYPPISGLVVEIERRDIFIPITQVGSLEPAGAQLAFASIDLRGFQRRTGEVLLAHDILDKQLIDIDGRRVIRANDLQLYSVDESVRLTAVDVSGEALLRRLVNGRFFADSKLGPEAPRAGRGRLRRQRDMRPSLIAWSDVEPLRAGVPDVRLRLSHERLALLHPVDIARIAEELSYKESAEIIESLDDETAAETLQEMDEERQADIVETMDQDRAADILEEMEPDDAADLLGDLDEVQAEELLRRMDREEAEDVEELLSYPEDSAGGMMTSRFITVPPGLTVDDTIVVLRELRDAPDVIDYLYVVENDDIPEGDLARFISEGEGRLLGIVTLRDLLLSPGSRTLGELMTTDVVWVGVEESKDAATRLMAEYNLLALPVLDDRERIRGIITVDDAMEALLPEPWLKRLPQVFR